MMKKASTPTGLAPKPECGAPILLGFETKEANMW